jgi:transposase
MRGYKYYPESLKREVVREILSGHISKEEARRKYEISASSSLINEWISKFERSGRSNKNLMDYNKLDKEELIKLIKELERKLEDEQIRSLGYSKMIDIAEEQLKISIRKKPGTKQSKK